MLFLIFSQIAFQVELNFQLLNIQMQTRQEDDACMHDFMFSKQNTYSFSKVFNFSDFFEYPY